MANGPSPSRDVPAAGSKTAAPVRIYVLWQPRYAPGLDVARALYTWFRLETMEGIPVFFRSVNAPGKDLPPEVPDDCELNYVVPLVEAHMVADPQWRLYVTGMLRRADVRLFPVALDPLAYQMPVELRGLNFIRHDLTRTPSPPLEALLSQLTEVLCRDLRAQETAHAGVRSEDEARRMPVPGKIKLFLSHAKADGTEVPVQLKEYIQTHTQCETFYDETDIASGHDFAQVLEAAIRKESAGMIVIHGDHYAERPWCRREIRRFQHPLAEHGEGLEEGRAAAYFVPPLVVLENMSGRRIARTIPELGHAPCLRWNAGSERLIISTLLREILLGLFYRRLVRQFRRRESETSLLVNRAPDPILAQQLLNAHRQHRPKAKPISCVRYPGYGLSQLEKDGLKETLPDIEFHSLSDSGETGFSLERLAGETLRLGTGNASDILTAGLDDEHNKELLIRLLRPLCRHQLSILYGGAMPNSNEPWGSSRFRVNFTEVCLNLLLSERSSSTGTQRNTARLYNVSVWPASDAVTERTIAEWTDVCSFHRVLPEAIGLGTPPEPLVGVEPGPDEALTPAERRRWRARRETEAQAIQLRRDVLRAQCLTHMRRACCRGLAFPVPDRNPGDPATVEVRPLAHLFLGGRIEHVSGVAPGLFEEILYALEAQQPVFLIGAGWGAAGALARWLLTRPAQRPAELSSETYLTDPVTRRVNEALMRRPGRRAATKPVTLGRVLDGLWERLNSIPKASGPAALLNNGLDDADNRRLLDPETGYGTICRLVWKGLVALAGRGR